MRPVVFLDIDGVLHINGDRAGTFNAECVKALNWLTDTADARIVLSSSWRDMPSIRTILKEENVAAQMIGKTPRLLHGAMCLSSTCYMCATRGDEIQIWLDTHARRQFVIIDDDADMGDLMDHLVQTDPDSENGLTMPLAELALRKIQ